MDFDKNHLPGFMRGSVPPMPVQKYIETVIQAEHDAIEKAIEEALQGGMCGVRIDKTWWGEIRSVRVDPAVPYGEVHEHRDKDNRVRPFGSYFN